jgi:hypothetical protein
MDKAMKTPFIPTIENNPEGYARALVSRYMRRVLPTPWAGAVGGRNAALFQF